MNHRHRPSKSTVGPFFGPVNTNKRRAAHGNICVRETCRCGATRLVNRNGVHVERGHWTADR